MPMISNGNVDTEQSRMRTFCCVPVSSFAGPAFSFANLLATNPIHERLDCGEQRKTPLDAHIRLEYGFVAQILGWDSLYVSSMITGRHEQLGPYQI